MATNTTKLNLPRPDASDNFNRAAYNGLIDAIDANVGAKLDAKIETSKAGAANGVATLGADGKVPATQLNVSPPADASTTQKGVVQLSSATDSTSETLAATPKAVKDAKDSLSTQIGILSGLNTTAKSNLVAAVNELFTFANDGKAKWSNVVGSPLASSDTFTQMQTKTQTIKNTLATNLTAKGQASTGTETLTALVNKVANVNTGKKYATGTAYTNQVSGSMDFNPSVITVTLPGVGVSWVFVRTLNSNNFWRLGTNINQNNGAVTNSFTVYTGYGGEYTTWIAYE